MHLNVFEVGGSGGGGGGGGPPGPRKLDRFPYLLSSPDVILCGEGNCLRRYGRLIVNESVLRIAPKSFGTTIFHRN